MPVSPPSAPARPVRRPHRPVVTLLGALAPVSLLAACAAGGPTPSPQPTADPGDAPAAVADQYPLTLDNCGFPVTVDSPPERVVTIKSSTVELMLALGLGDRVVGAAFLDGPLPDVPGAEEIDVIADSAPGQEAVLTLEPDLVFAGWESNFAADSAGERSALDTLGVATYVAPSACKSEGYMPDPLTFDVVFEEIEQAGELFGVADRARDLVDEQRAALAEVEPDARGLTALWYSSGNDVPYVGAGIGAPQMIMDAVGLENVAADVHDTWTSYGWEQIVEDDPDVLVLVDAEWNTAANKIEQLETRPATSLLTAVQEERYLIVPFASTEAGVRNVGAVQDLSAQLAELDLP